MKDVEDKIISQAAHEERSCNTLDIQEKREEDLYLATQSQTIKIPTSTEEQAMGISDRQIESERKLFSYFPDFITVISFQINKEEWQ